MITKERLKELIEQGATVYMARAYTEGIYLLPENFEANDKELVFKYKIYAVPLEDLFETALILFIVHYSLCYSLGQNGFCLGLDIIGFAYIL